LDDVEEIRVELKHLGTFTIDVAPKHRASVPSTIGKRRLPRNKPKRVHPRISYWDILVEAYSHRHVDE
jgi:hypothetical protein